MVQDGHDQGGQIGNTPHIQETREMIVIIYCVCTMYCMKRKRAIVCRFFLLISSHFYPLPFLEASRCGLERSIYPSTGTCLAFLVSRIGS